MKFNTIREMEIALSKITNLNDFGETIVFKSQGILYTVRFAGKSYGGNREIYFIGDNTACNIRISFTGDGRNINVTEVSVKKI